MIYICFASLVILSTMFILPGRIQHLSAYLTDRATEVNYIKPGVNVSKIQEEFPEQGELPEQGKTYVKKVSVKNQTSVPCYIRVSVDYSDSRIGNAASLVGLNTKDWEYIGIDQPKTGGYYYYKEAILPGESTSNLFDGIRFSNNMDGSFFETGEDFDVIVYEESLQQGSYTSYSKAWNDFLRE